MAEKSSELDKIKTAENDFEFNDKNETPAKDETSGNIPAEIPDEPEAIREKIEETRRGMSETIDAIQEKLSISNISEQVKEQITEQISGAVETIKTTVSIATIGKAGQVMKNIGKELKKSNIGKIAGNNPLPIFLIGLGIGLLVFNRNKGRNSVDSAKPTSRRKLHNSEPGDSKERKTNAISQKIGESANSAYESASSAAHQVYESVTGAAGDAYGKVEDLGGQVREHYDYYLEANPLAVGAVALAIGAAVGLAIPSTRYEGKIMGEARENLLSKAQTAASGAFEKVREVVSQTKESIIEDAKEIVSEAKDSLTENFDSANSERQSKA